MKQFLPFILFVANSTFANVVCQTVKVPQTNPEKYLQRCYLGEHQVKISKHAEATAQVTECRLNKKNGEVVKLIATDTNVTDIQLKVRGVDLGDIPKLKSGNQFGLGLSIVEIGDNEAVQCATVIGGFPKVLKY